MKFQKTLLAVSLAAAAVATNAQNANPVTVTENLLNNSAKDVVGNSIYQNGWVIAPVHSIHAKDSVSADVDRTWLPTITGIQNGTKSIDLGTGAVGASQAGNAVTYDVFKYKTLDGTTVYQFENSVTRQREGGTYVVDVTGNLSKYNGASPIDPNTLAKGGKVDGAKGTTAITGFQNRQINGEHVVYGYQGGTVTSAGSVEGYVTNDKVATSEFITGPLDETRINDLLIYVMCKQVFLQIQVLVQ